jgi:hypothetical protein
MKLLRALALKALLALGLGDTRKWRHHPDDPPEVALYGAQKVAKTKRADHNRSA